MISENFKKDLELIAEIKNSLMVKFVRCTEDISKIIEDHKKKSYQLQIDDEIECFYLQGGFNHFARLCNELIDSFNILLNFLGSFEREEAFHDALEKYEKFKKAEDSPDNILKTEFKSETLH